MRYFRGQVGFLTLLLLAGCGSQRPAAPAPAAPAGGGAGATPMMVGLGPSGGPSDAGQVRAADVSVLFVGNSHTTIHDLPGLVGKMIQFRHPNKKVCTHVVGVGHLDDTARDPRCRQEIESRPWKYVVLQAQKISTSGKFDYSRQEGIDTARLAREKGAAVFFFCEWGLRDKAGDGPRHEKIYREMARDAGVGLAPIGRAWDLALARRPELPLYAPDGNHQSATGAFLTACVLFGRLSGESPAELASFPYPDLGEGERKLLADAAARAIAEVNGKDDR